MTYLEELEQAVADVKSALPGMKLLENEPFKNHDSFHIGGPVRAMAAPSDVFALTKVCYELKKNHIAPFIVGNGTNMVIPDEGLQIFVISTEKLQKIWRQEDGSIYAEAGVSLAKLSQFAQQNGLAGLEFASGIPGSLGGGVLMNAGAYGGEMKDAVRSVVCYDLREQGLFEVERENCGFSYRHSAFQELNCVVLSAVFELSPGDPDEIAAKMREMNEKRRQSQPLDLPSAGSAFKRPEGGFAAALIEQAGLKGFSVGAVEVSKKHSGFVVSTGEASYDDLVELLQQVREKVFEASKIRLEPEIRIYPKDMILADNFAQLETAAALRKIVDDMKSGGETKE